jgi:hypothetical protein
MFPLWLHWMSIICIKQKWIRLHAWDAAAIKQVANHWLQKQWDFSTGSMHLFLNWLFQPYQTTIWPLAEVTLPRPTPVDMGNGFVAPDSPPSKNPGVFWQSACEIAVTWLSVKHWAAFKISHEDIICIQQYKRGSRVLQWKTRENCSFHRLH